MSGIRKSSLYYDGKLHTIIEKTSEPFLDLHYVVTDKGKCTTCCPGYFSYYQIEDEKIFLKEFVTCYPENILKDKDEKTVSDKIEIFRSFGNELIQSDINQFIDFTGNLLIGSEVEPYFRFSRMGVASFWQFTDLKELIITNGRVVECIDRSHISKEILKVAKTLPYDDFEGTEMQAFDAAAMRTDEIWWMKRYQNH